MRPQKNRIPPILPLKNDPSARFLPWLMAVISFLACVALAATLSLHHLSQRWQADLQHGMTIEIPSLGNITDADDPTLIGQADHMTRQAVIRRLQETAGIIAIHPVPIEEIRRIMTPWLADTSLLAGLQLPQLIDVKLDPNVTIQPEKLRQRLNDISPGISIQMHAHSLAGLTAPARLARTVAITVMIAAGLACLLVVGFAARAGLRAHESLIGLLHLLGASDHDIAWAFQRHILWHSLLGAGIGLALALGALQGVQQFFHADDRNQPWMASLGLLGMDWLLVSLTPVLLSGLALAAAWQIVQRTLDQDHL